MKSKLLFLFLFLGQSLSFQTFTEAPYVPFAGVYWSSIAFADVDGDNDQDVLITGTGSQLGPTTKLYRNDGAGNFTEVMGTPFDRVLDSSIAFSDVDGDNDQDVLITGKTNPAGVSIAKLYMNNGAGNFTEVIGTPFEGVERSKIAFSDVDGDNDQDVLISGVNNTSALISKLYMNDGAGNFTEAMPLPFDGILLRSIAFSDVDGDNDQDILITGAYSSWTPVSKLYMNDGAGNFSEVMGTPFFDAEASSTAFSDVDGDNDQDVLITGLDSSWTPVSKLYRNDGAGNFTEVMGTLFLGVYWSSIAFADVDGDNDQDVLITGNSSPGVRTSKLYRNDGAGNFSEVMGTPFDGVGNSSIAFADVDGDNDQDVLITGMQDITLDPISKLYINDGIVSSSDVLVNRFSFDFTFYPNPTKANNLNVSFGSRENGLITVSIFDLNGRLLSQEQRRSVIGQQTFSMNITSLTSGNYSIQLDDGKRIGVCKFLVQ